MNLDVPDQSNSVLSGEVVVDGIALGMAEDNTKIQVKSSKKGQITKDIDELVQMGFPRKRARAAYEQCTGLAETAELLAACKDTEEGYEEIGQLRANNKRQRVESEGSDY